MKVSTPNGPRGYSQISDPSAFFQTFAGAPMRVSTSRAEAPGLMAEKLAHAANRAGSSSARARENIVFMAPPIASGVVVHPEDFPDPLGGRDRSCAQVEEHFEEHRILLLVAPGPHLFVARAEHHDLPGLAEQPPHLVAGHSRVHLRKIFFAQHLVGLPDGAVGSKGHHVGLPPERPSRIFPDLRSVGVLPDRLRRAELRLDLLRGHSARDGGENWGFLKGRPDRGGDYEEYGFLHFGCP